METLRTETERGVRHIVLCRADDYNTITPTLRDELAAAIDAAEADREVHVILLRAEGPAFCAGYGLDWSTDAQSREGAQGDPQSGGRRRVWDSVADMRMLGTLFDGVARHTQEGLDFVTRAQEVGFRQAVRERDDPFDDYGSRRKP
jgi:enoyl-CoA hydratase/carnithine racemase